MRAGCIVLVACSGAEESRPIPQFVDAEVEGDCADDALYAEPYGGILRRVDDLEEEDGALAEGFGTVITDEVAFDAFLTDLKVQPANRPVVDFATEQVAAVWLERCRVEVERVELLRKPDASYVFEVEFVDRAANCDYDCFGTMQTLILESFTNEEPASVCRRVRAGCEP
jgi:hypothetical protein